MRLKSATHNLPGLETEVEFFGRGDFSDGFGAWFGDGLDDSLDSVLFDFEGGCDSSGDCDEEIALS